MRINYAHIQQKPKNIFDDMVQAISKKIIEYFANWVKLKIIIHHSNIGKRYFHEREIWWASIGANIGYEENGKNDNYERPVLILKKFNKEIFWGLPLTSKEKTGKYYFTTTHNNKKYSVIISQLRILSSKRLLRNIRKLPKNCTGLCYT